MSDDSRIAKGKACGTSINAIFQKNCAKISTDSPFPISSSTYLHTNCIISTNWQMKNVPTNSRPNCLAINISNFFIRNVITFKICTLCTYQGAKLAQKTQILTYFVFFYNIIRLHYVYRAVLCGYSNWAMRLFELRHAATRIDHNEYSHPPKGLSL